MSEHKSADRRGVVRRKPPTSAQLKAEKVTQATESPIRIEAYKLALANLHKPWARRYIRNFRFTI
jgi:hypothetical protein